MKIVISDILEIQKEELSSQIEALSSLGHEVKAYDTRPKDQSDLVQRAADADVLVITNYPLPKETLSQLNNLKMISVGFTGTDHIDIEYCKENDITVSNAAGYSTSAVAELAVSLSLNVLRGCVTGDAMVRESQGRGQISGSELYGKTVGIIGTGTIGMHTAKIFEAFGCRVLGWSRSERKGFAGSYVSLDELLLQSDVVSLHTPLSAETIGLLGVSEFKKMKSTAIVVNCARGPVLDIEGLKEALVSKEIAGAGIDVFDIEPPLPKTHVLLDCPNLVLTPHIAYATQESFSRRAVIVFENISAWVAGNPVNVVCGNLVKN